MINNLQAADIIIDFARHPNTPGAYFMQKYELDKATYDRMLWEAYPALVYRKAATDMLKTMQDVYNRLMTLINLVAGEEDIEAKIHLLKQMKAALEDMQARRQFMVDNLDKELCTTDERELTLTARRKGVVTCGRDSVSKAGGKDD